MKNFFKSKIITRTLLGMSLALVMIGGVFVLSLPAQATVSGGAIAGIAGADLVAGTADVDYSVSFDTDINDQGNSLTVTFPVGYTITDGDLTASAVKNSGGTLAGKISVNGADWAVNTVTGSTANRTITITVNAVDFGFGTGTAFRVVTGVQNPTTAGVTGTFSITNNTVGEVAQTDISGVTITGESASKLVFTVDADGSVSGNALTTQPVVTAYDQYDNVDTSFTGTVTLTEGALGELTNNTADAVAGVATFSGLTYTATADSQSFTLTADEAGSLTNDTSGPIVSDVVATKLVISGVAGAVDSAVEFAENITLTVTAVDEGDMTDTDEVSTFSIIMDDSTGDDLALTNNTGTLVAGTATLTTVNITAADLTTTTPDGNTLSLAATDTGVGDTLTRSAADETLTIDFVATKLLVTQQPTGAVDEVALTQQPIVKAVDANNNIDTANSTEVITASTATVGAAVGGTVTATMSSGVATFVGLRADVSGAFTDGADVTLTFDDDGDFAGLANFAAVNASATALDVVSTIFVWTQDPSSVGDCVSGLACDTQGIIQAQDAHGNLDSGKSDTVIISVKTGGGTLVGTSPQAMTSGSLTTSGIGYTATADDEAFTLAANGTLTEGVSGSIESDVLATKLLISGVSSLANTPNAQFADDITLTVSAVNAQGTLDNDDISTFSVAVTDDSDDALTETNNTGTLVAGTATLTTVNITAADLTATTADGDGLKLIATDTGGTASELTASVADETLTIDFVATKLLVTQQPTGAVDEVALTQQPIVKAVDANNNIDTANSTEVITASTATVGAAVGGTVTATMSSGVATFVGLRADVSGTFTDGADVTLAFDDDGGFDGLGDFAAVDASATALDVVATKLVWTQDPATCTSGAVCDTQGIIVARDAHDNLDSGFADDITIAVASGGGSLVGTSPQAMTSGSLTTSGIGYTATADQQAFTLSADDAGTDLTQGVSGSVTADVVATKLVISGVSGATDSAVEFTENITLTVSAVDANDVIDTADTSAFTVTVTDDSNDALTETNNTSTLVAGTKEITNLNITAADLTVTTADGDGLKLIASDDGVILSDSAADTTLTIDFVATKFVWTQDPATCVSGLVCTTQGIIQAQDANDNLDSDKADTVTISVASGGGDLVGTAAQGMTSGTMTTAGIGYTATADQQAFTLAADGTLTQGVSGSVTSDVVATKFLVTLNTNTPAAGVADTLTLTAVDADDTTDTGYDPSGLTFSFLDSSVTGLASHVSPGGDSPTIPDSATVIAAFGSGTADLVTFTLVNAETLGAITVNDETLTGDSASVAVKNTAAVAFTVTPETLTPSVGTAYDMTITAIDEFGNTVSGANGATTHTGLATFSWTATSPTISPSSYTFLTGDAGTKIISNALTFNTAEAGKTITVSDYRGVITGTSGSITVTSTADVAAPTVDSQTPVDDSTDQVITVSPTVTFSEAMDVDTVNTNTVQLRLYSDDAIINSVVTYNTGTYVATMNPVDSLSNNTQYYIWVSGAKDVAGNSVTAYATKANQEFTTVALGDGSLAVTGINSIETFAAVAGGWPDGDSSTADGWSWDFYITVPTTETSFAIKFANWASGSNTIAAANNIRFFTAQASANADADNARLITVAGTDSAVITLDGELSVSDAAAVGMDDPATLPGRQIKVTVQAQIPTGSSAGSYSTQYGVTSN